VRVEVNQILLAPVVVALCRVGVHLEAEAITADNVLGDIDGDETPSNCCSC